jgi:hypothetical protein
VAEQLEGTNPQIVGERLALESQIENVARAIDRVTNVMQLGPLDEKRLREMDQMTVFLNGELSRLDAQMAGIQREVTGTQLTQAQTPTLQTVPIPAPLNVSVTSIRVTKISIPLNTPGRHEVSARITTLEGGRFVTSFDELVDHGGALDKNVTLKLGSYRMNVMVKSLSDGSTAAQTLDFEVQ